MKLFEVSTKRILRIGHRGAGGHAPENTLAALETGIALGVDYLEVDIQQTCDGHLMLMHDKFVDRTTDGTGRLSEMSLEEVRQLDAGNGQSVPLLTESLALVNGRAGMILESISPGIGPAVHTGSQRLRIYGTSDLLVLST